MQLDSELVNKVTEQVILMLRQQGMSVAGAAVHPADGSSAPPRAAGPAKPAGGKASHAPARPVSAGKVFITADMLAQRLAGGGGAVELAPNEFLTPGAVDLAQQRHLAVRRSAGAPAGAGSAPSIGQDADRSPAKVSAAPGETCACTSLGVVTASAGDAVRAMLAGLAREGLTLVDMTVGDCWMADLRRLCQAVATGQVARGAAILPYAADAMVLANKTKGIRAVQGTRPESVAAGVRHFAANVLILEHAFSTYHQMRTMLRLFASAGGGQGGGVLASAIGQLEGG